MKVSTWNVNSLRVRLPLVLQWLEREQPDIVCLQETKCEDHHFPTADLTAAGYHITFSGQKTYNGVAILSRTPAENVICGIPDFADEQKRVIAAEFCGIKVICAYFPNGQTIDSEKYGYKLRWIEALTHWIEQAVQDSPNLILTGDFNIAPEDRDVHDPQAWAGQVLVSEPERTAFHKLTALGLTDAFRLFDQPEKSYTWWDYRMMAFRRNMGLRIDHILLTKNLVAHCTQCSIDRETRKAEKPSDHASVTVTLDWPTEHQYKVV